MLMLSYAHFHNFWERKKKASNEWLKTSIDIYLISDKIKLKRLELFKCTFKVLCNGI